MVKLDEDAPSPRLCVIEKEFPEQEYGFNLHAERGKCQYIGNVDPDSPANRASLCPGDRIYAVNGHPVADETHKQVERLADACKQLGEQKKPPHDTDYPVLILSASLSLP